MPVGAVVVDMDHIVRWQDLEEQAAVDLVLLLQTHQVVQVLLIPVAAVAVAVVAEVEQTQMDPADRVLLSYPMQVQLFAGLAELLRPIHQGSTHIGYTHLLHRVHILRNLWLNIEKGFRCLSHYLP
jgi:hypothetical protein